MTQKGFFAGVDVGTTTTKAVIISADKQVVGSFVRRTGADLTTAALTTLEEAASLAGVSPDVVKAIAATG